VYYVTAVIAAGGRGRRMQASINKQFLELDGKPILAHTLEIFESCPLINEIVVVTADGEREYCRKAVVEPYGFRKVRKIVSGGRERQDSVYNGLKEIDDRCEYVAVHDGARPLLTSEILLEALCAGFKEGAAAVAVPVKDTIKLADSRGFVAETPDRDRLWAVQTPQVFKREIIFGAYEHALKHSLKGSDDSVLVEKLGYPVKLVRGEYENIKVTTPEDLEIAAAILERRRRSREGGDRI